MPSRSSAPSTASLDLGQQTRLMTLLGGLARDGHAILVSVHQPELALRWFNRAILLHEGRVLGDGPPRTTVTGDSLSRLYGIDARLIEADETLFLLAAVGREGA